MSTIKIVVVVVQEAIDAFTLLPNADTGFNQIKAWRVIKLDLHDDYVH